MAIFDANPVSDFLAQVGGALSAQATGGSQGLENFLGRLAQRQAQQSQQEFERESKLRDQMYQESRDRKQRAHERGMQAARISADERARRSDKDEGYEQTARGMLLSARKDADSRVALESLIRANNPNMPAELAIDFNDTEIALPLVMGLVKGGGSQRQLAETTEQRQQIVGKQREMFGDAEFEVDPTNPNWQADYLKTEQAFNTSRSKFTGIQSEAAQLAQELGRLQETMPNLSGEQYTLQHTDLARRYVSLVDRLDSLQETSDPRFFSETAYLGQALAPLETQLGTLEAAIGRQPVEKGRDLVAQWELSDPESFPGLTIPGLGGRPDPNNEDVGQVRNFRALLNSGAFRAKEQQFQSQAGALIAVTDSEAQYLDPELRSLRSRLIEMQADGKLNLGNLITQLRDTRQAGDMLGGEDTSKLISDVGNINADLMRRQLGTQVASANALSQARQLNNVFSMTSGFGTALFDTDQELEQALQNYGTLEGGVKVPGEDFVQRMISDDAGLQRIVEKTMVSGYAGFDLADQTIERVEAALERFGASSPQNLERARRMVQSMTGQLAALEPNREAELLDGYSSPITDRYLAQVTSPNPSSLAALPVEQQIEAEQAYVSNVFGFRISATDLTRRVQEAAEAAARASAPFEQESAIFFTNQFARGREQALRLPAEAEGDANFSARDLVDLWSRSVPSFKAMLNRPGKVRNQLGTMYGRISGRSWATTAETQSYLLGQNSLSRQYRQSRTAKELDENTDNILGFVDLMRGMEIPALRQELGSDATKMAMLTQLQNTLREISLDQALVTLAGESPSGLSLAQLGFDDAGIVSVTEVGTPTLSTLTQVPFDIDAELRNVDAATAELGRRALGEWVELGSGEGAVVDEMMLESRKAELTRRREELTTLKDATVVESLGNRSVDALGAFMLAADISTPKLLSASAAENLALITGQPLDLIGMDVKTIDQVVRNMQNVETEVQALDRLFDLASQSVMIRAKAEQLPITQVAPQGLRPMAMKLMDARINDTKAEIYAIAREIAQREQSLGRLLTAKDLPPSMAAELTSTDFDSMESPENERLPLLRAAKIWAAHNTLR